MHKPTRKLKGIIHHATAELRKPQYVLHVYKNDSRSVVGDHILTIEPIDMNDAIIELTTYIDNKVMFGDWDFVDGVVAQQMNCNEQYCIEDVPCNFKLFYENEHGYRYDCEVRFE